MTRLLSAYPKKFHNQFILFFSMNFVPFHLKETTQSITQIIRISSCHILIYRQISMATSKATNDHFPAKNMKFSRKQFIRPNSRETRGLDHIMTTFCEKHEILQTGIYSTISPRKSADLTKIARISCISRFQRPIPSPPQTKNLQLVKFRPSPAHAHS